MPHYVVICVMPFNAALMQFVWQQQEHLASIPKVLTQLEAGY